MKVTNNRGHHPKTMTISGIEFKVKKVVELDNGAIIPMPNIKMMSEKREIETGNELAIENYTREFGKPPKDLETALEWNREYTDAIIEKCKANPVTIHLTPDGKIITEEM